MIKVAGVGGLVIAGLVVGYVAGGARSDMEHERTNRERGQEISTLKTNNGAFAQENKMLLRRVTEYEAAIKAWVEYGEKTNDAIKTADTQVFIQRQIIYAKSQLDSIDPSLHYYSSEALPAINSRREELRRIIEAYTSKLNCR